MKRAVLVTVCLLMVPLLYLASWAWDIQRYQTRQTRADHWPD